ncbi:ComEA family DNA-binding protein [Roseiflexus castenholzii]|uniref:Competence protein ComEA helix-hairpin-helix repeat protein n=1 Tax=Roseiflexus castenholzii (strain DSM 13941 / HLO8) TaxID=383372 RepID=A7NJW3_ROSCS|nr:ComEA family DNA-binding protein [Roseiflexus castenholzii]ABU57783.1 competence protein ComEA helix-hairpin-helix repeat protein [Roseiflexus castenholzii DSM 13941]
MELFSELMQRKALVAAALLFALGAGILGQTALERLTPQGVQSGPNEPAADVSDDTFVEDSLDQDESVRPATPTRVACIVAYISGAVRAPDVYQLPVGARVKDLVLAAGGLSDDADIERINLAAPIADGQHVRVPWIGDGATMAATAPTESPASGESSGLIDLNRATAAELDALPGIGNVLANRIVEWREREGPFQSVDDLGKVEGIGPALLAKLKPLVTVAP